MLDLRLEAGAENFRIQRIFEAIAHGGGVIAVDPCSYRRELDMETLVWTRGRAFPLSRLESRGSRYVVVLYEPPRRGATSIACPRSQPVRSSTA